MVDVWNHISIIKISLDIREIGYKMVQLSLSLIFNLYCFNKNLMLS